MRPGRIQFLGGSIGIALLALMVVAMPARAADPVFPTGLRIGLVPPQGMVPSKAFPGFEDPAKSAIIIMSVLPADAYPELEKTVAADVLKKEGITVETREPMQLQFGGGLLIVGTQTTDNVLFRDWLLIAAADGFTALVRVHVPEHDDVYTDAVMRAALATLTVRATVPDQEWLSVLPFTIGDLAGFHVQGVIPGQAVMLTYDADGESFNARLYVGAQEGGPAEAGDRATFARLAFDAIAGIKDVHITMSEPLRIGNQPGFQTMAQAKGTVSGIDITVVQWLRFGTGGFMQMVGMGRTENWSHTLTRMRTVRDSIDLK
jgi:hypothetical protein